MADVDTPWYAAGLRFACTGCGDCCRGQGYVWVDEAEIRSIADFLGSEPDRFGRRYLRRVGRRLSLVDQPNDDCIFFADGCSIYPVRPRQCRTYPFWPRCLASDKSWLRAARDCEGIDDGRRYALDEIERLRAGHGETVAPEDDEA